MKFKKKHDEEEVGFAISSMIDIVFLLLIFFIVASQLKELEVEKEVELPIADIAQKKELEGVLEIQINVLGADKDNKIKVAGEDVSIDELTSQLNSLTQHDDRPKKVFIRGDQEAHYGRIMNIMRSCAQAGLWDVSFASFKEKESKIQNQ